MKCRSFLAHRRWLPEPEKIADSCYILPAARLPKSRTRTGEPAGVYYKLPGVTGRCWMPDNAGITEYA